MPKNLVLAASAGTGKTHALVGVVVHLLLGGRTGGVVDPSKIVATTFSRKAAAEIRDRVSREIERLALSPSTSSYVEGLREAIAQAASTSNAATPASMTTASTVTDNEIAKRARRALVRLPLARFGTLHSFATGIVQRYAVELGLGPGFELATEADVRLRMEDAIAGALERRLEQRADDLRQLAEAAGGVDRVVYAFRRILTQLEEDGRSARDLEIDSTDVHEIEGQMRELLAHARAVSTFPKCADPSYALARAWDAKDESAIEEAIAALTAVPAHGKKPPEVEQFFAFRKELPGLTNEERGRRFARLWRARHGFSKMALLVREILAEAEAEIERASRTRATLAFGEILRAARELLRDHTDVADEVGAGIEALLVDEFQDTSRVQRDLLQLLWARPEARPAAGIVPPLSAMRGQGLLVVGDRKQSIYGFRGADVGVFAELAVGLAGSSARKALGIPVGVTWEPKEPVADFHALRFNRRSVPSILAFANTFSARRFQVADPPPELFEIEYVPRTEDLLDPNAPLPDDSAYEHDDGTPILRVFDDGTMPPPSRVPLPPGDPPATTWLRVNPKGASSTRLEEALVIADRIRSLTDASSKASVGAEETSFRDIAVLATTNGMLDATAFALAQLDIPYVVAGKSFFRAREISDVTSMLSLILEPSDRIAMLDVLRGPWASVHDETLLGLVDDAQGLVPPDRWSRPPHPDLVREEDRETLAEIAEIVLSLHRCSTRLAAGDLLRAAVASRALLTVLAGMPRGEQRVANVEKLLGMADRHPDARAFRAWLEEAKEREVGESEAATFNEKDDAVRLLTVHASKGLDFKIVFVPEIGAGVPRSERNVARIDLGAGEERNKLCVRIVDSAGLVLEPPSYLRAHETTKRRERAERQRLAYVAVTRAAKRLFLVGGRAREVTADAGTSTLAALVDFPSAMLSTEYVDVPPPRALARVATMPEITLPPVQRRRLPSWRVLPVAPMALSDFAYCPRRFELLHVLGVPEREIDVRSEELLTRSVLKKVTVEEAVPTALQACGVREDAPLHAVIAGRVRSFFRMRYVQAMHAAGVTVERESPFILPIEDPEGRRVVLHGKMDLVVAWPDDSIDVLLYRLTPPVNEEATSFEVEIYSLAARARFANARRLRVGLASLVAEGKPGEPRWIDLTTPTPTKAIEERVIQLGASLISARWENRYPRVDVSRCKNILCGFMDRCHPSSPPSGTEENPPLDTTM